MTEQAGHTPGPWDANPEDANWPHKQTVCIRAPGFGVVAFMNVDGQSPLLEKQRANIRLVKFAPDLLEALRPFAALLDQVVTHDLVGEANVTCQVSVNDIRRARAAILKATKEK